MQRGRRLTQPFNRPLAFEDRSFIKWNTYNKNCQELWSKEKLSLIALYATRLFEYYIVGKKLFQNCYYYEASRVIVHSNIVEIVVDKILFLSFKI